MFLNHLKIAIRSLLKKRFYSLINILGLALGLMAATFIWQFVSFERSYDDFHINADKIFRIPSSYLTGGVQDSKDAMASAPIGPALKAEYAEVESFVRVTPEYGRTVFQKGDQKYEERKIFYVDSNFFDFFGFPLIAGDKDGVLREPFSIVLTQHLAEKYFGPMETWSQSPIGQTIRVNNLVDAEITGIALDVPENSHLKFDALVSFVTFPMINGDPSDQWEWNDFYTYIQLKDPTQAPAFDIKLVDFADRHLNSQGSQEYRVEYFTQPLKDIHLHSNLAYEAEPNGDASTIQFLWIIAVAILLIAWANYINLSTARAQERSREVGVRKVIGADKKSLVLQFLTEAFLVNAAAIMLALVLVYTLQPLMNEWTGKALVSFAGGATIWAPISLLVLCLGTVFSGLYPAFILSSFSPARTIKSSEGLGNHDIFRKVLVTFQYACSIVLMISTAIIFRQLNYMKNAELGFSLDQKIVVNAASVYHDSIERQLFDAFRNGLLQNPKISSVTASSAIPGKYYYDLDAVGGIRLQGTNQDQGASFTSYRIDEDYFATYGIEIIAGKNFSRETSADDFGFAVNEAALPLLGIKTPEEAIGQMIRWQQDDRVWPIYSVFKNYHHKSLRHQYEPTILWHFKSDPDPLYYTIKFEGESRQDLTRLLSQVESSWGQVFPDNPFTFFFFDDQFNQQYEADARLGRIIGLFALFAVLIACLGLFGLTSYMITVKTKEIGIRKILGASISSIVYVLTKDFMRLVLLSLVVAVPLGLYFGSRWLNNFAYKTSLSWWIFILSGGLAIFIALSTISLQSVKAALVNPIRALRDD